MLEQFTYKQKFWAATGGIVLLALIVWFGTVSKTVQLVIECEQLENQLAISNHGASAISDMKGRIDRFDELIGAGEFNSDEIQESLISLIDSEMKGNVSISEVFPIHQAKQMNYQLMTYSVKAEGDFRELVTLSQLLEENFEWARLKSVSFETEKDPRTKRTKLYATYYLQNIRKA